MECGICTLIEDGEDSELRKVVYEVTLTEEPYPSNGTPSFASGVLIDQSGM